MNIVEVPFPILQKGHVLVQNHFSVVSPGTEGKTVADARKGYIAKARSRRADVLKVLAMARREGAKVAYDRTMNRLEAPSPLGYSTAGVVLAVGEGVRGFVPGDRVACGGASASHAEVISVPKNLCVKVPASVELKHAAFATIAAIAVQGCRRAEIAFGETVAVIGLGLVGQLTVRIIKAAGAQPCAVDINPGQVSLAKSICGGSAFTRDVDGLEDLVFELSGGIGADSVIICAGATSTDPIDLAGRLCRPKGKVVVVGGVPTGFSRKEYYRKELDLRMSCSYGPGRYDPSYEVHGNDYPVGYVRWTENRNMSSFISLLRNSSLAFEGLITHELEFSSAPDAYDLILGRNEVITGIVLGYEVTRPIARSITFCPRPHLSRPEKTPVVGVIGAGSFAQNVMMPAMQGLCRMKSLSTGRGLSAFHLAKKYGIESCVDDPLEIVHDNGINTAVILTRHDSHADLVKRCLVEGKNVFVEKPLALCFKELQELMAASGDVQFDGKKPILMVGFNRRFSTYVQEIKDSIGHPGSMAIDIRVNAGRIDPGHWAHDQLLGGGRIIGELCHFIDLAQFLANSEVRSVAACAMETEPALMDTVALVLAFESGAVATVSYFSNGNSRVKKERIEVFSRGTAYLLDDFSSLTITTGRSKKVVKKGQDKGHAAGIRGFMEAVTSGSESPIPIGELVSATLVTFAVETAIREGRTVYLNEEFTLDRL